MTNFVAMFKSTDLNMPPLFGAAGSLLNVLNACLVDGPGYTGIAIVSITRAGTVATVTVSAANGLRIKDQAFVTVSGVTGADGTLYNIGALWTRASATTYTYNMLGTPTGSAAGTPVASLALSVTSATESSTNYSVTLAQADTSLFVGAYVTFSGGSPGGFNIAMKINTVTDSTHIICTGPGGLGTITGTITYQRSPLQWTRPFTAGTNAQTYRSADASSDKFYLQVIDNAATAGAGKEAQIYGAEVMSADQTVTSGQFPTTVQAASGCPVRKSSTADSTTARAWVLFGDDRTFYLVATTGDANTSKQMGFGHFISYKAGDAFKTFIFGDGSAFNTANNATLFGLGSGTTMFANASGVNGYIARTFAQTGTSIVTVLTTPGGQTVTYPDPIASGLIVVPGFLSDTAGASGPRGRVPGCFFHCHSASPFTTYDESTGVTGLSGVTLVAIGAGSGNTNGQMLVDKFGPWT